MAYALTGDLQITSSDLKENSSTQTHNLGERATTGDGRYFRYSKAGGTALVVGKLQQSSAEVANHQNLTPAAAAIGDTSVTVTLGATAATANQYAGGWLMVTVTPGQGYQYKISSHPAADSAATLVVSLADPIRVALTTSSRVDLIANPYAGLIVAPTTQSSCVVGVAVTPITASYYGWLQVAGPANVLADGTVTVGDPVVGSNGTAGAVESVADGAEELLPVVGHAITAISSTEYGPIMLNLS